ncbi:MAG: NHL repeat-containing protein [Nitrospinales bacterium]
MPYPATGLKNFSLDFKNSFRRPRDGEKIELSPPSGFALMPEGGLVVADDFNHRIQLYDREHNLQTCFGEKGKDNGQFMYPRGIAVDSEGHIYVADSWNHRVQKFDASGNHLLTFGDHGEGWGQLNEPYDVLALPSGEIVVVERYNHRIQFFDAGGHSLGWVGARGTVLEDRLAQIYETPPHLFPRPVFEFPTSIAQDSLGNFFVADSGNHRIVKFDPRWNLVGVIGEKGGEAGQFQYPLCVATGPNDLLYVADLNNNRVQVFTSQGQFLTAIDEGGEKIQTPCLTLVDAEGRLYVGLTFNPAVLVFQTSSRSPDSIYKSFAEEQAKDFRVFFSRGNFHEETGSADLALEAYGKAVSILAAQGGQDSFDPSFGFEQAACLPLRFCRAAAQGPHDREIESSLLQCLDIYDALTRSLYQKILDRKKEWDDAATIYFRELIREENLILNQKEDPLAFNKKLYSAEKADKTFFREIRILFYYYRKVCEQKAEFVLALLHSELSAQGVEKLVASLESRYHAICGEINVILDDKENHEVAMVGALSGAENNEEKWESFRIKSMLNARLMDSLKHFLFELRSILKSIKATALKFQNASVRNCLTELFIKVPVASLIPSILLRIQEDWDTLPSLETEHKEILDIWLAGHRGQGEVRRVDNDFFAPVPYDVEDVDTGDIVRALLMEGAPPAKTEQGLACGNEIYPPESLGDDAENICAQLRAVLDNSATYEKKTAETFKELESFSLQKADLETKLKNVNPRDKKEPIPLRNNLQVVEFQINLLKRMIKTLEINEMNNLLKLVLGAALAAVAPVCRDRKPTRDLFDALRSYRDDLQARTASATLQMKSVVLKKGALEKQLKEELFKHDISHIDQSVKIKDGLLKAQIELNRLTADLARRFRPKNLLDKLFDFVSQAGEAASAQDGFRMKFKFVSGGLGLDAGHFLYPLGITHTPEGDLLIADYDRHLIRKFSREGVYRFSFGGMGNARGAFNSPAGVQVDPRGNIYVADQLNHRIQKLAPDGKFLLAFGDRGKQEERLGEIYSLSMDTENNIWVADPQHHRVAIFSPLGEYLRAIGKQGKRPEELCEPVSVCCLENGDYLVGDRSEYVLKRFNPKGELLHVLKKDIPTIDVVFFLTSDPRYGIFAAESLNKRLLRLNSKLEPVFIYHCPGDRAGGFGIIGGLSIHGDTLMVTDSGNHRIQAFELQLKDHVST